MSDDANQLQVPASFVALFVPPGRVKPLATQAHIAARFELCDDMAQMLVEPAQAQLWRHNVTADEVLLRVHQGLQAAATGLEPAEAQWVMHRLAELLEAGPWVAPPAVGGSNDTAEEAPATDAS